MADVPRVVLTGGVSGGHTFPLVAVARALRKRYARGVDLIFIGSHGFFENEAMSQENIKTYYIQTGKMRRYFSWQNFSDPFRIVIGFFQALWLLFRFMPDAVFSKGGSASVPVVFAAWLFRIPIVIHDSDAVAGRANKFAGRFAKRIAIAYPSAHAYFPEGRTSVTGNPVREGILQGNREAGFRRFSLDPGKKTIFVSGGSQGSQALNEVVLKALTMLLEKGVQVLHQTGNAHYDKIVQIMAQAQIELGRGGYMPKAFLTEQESADALAMADIVVARAGAGTIAELAATKKAAILVPLASAANDEQRLNAYAVAELGGAVVIEEQNLGEHILLEKISELLNNPDMRTTMGERLHSFYHPDAADAIAAGLAELIGG